MLRSALFQPLYGHLTGAMLGHPVVESRSRTPGVEQPSELTSGSLWDEVAEQFLETVDVAKGCDAAFCTLGLGQPRKAPKEEFWQVDVEWAGAFAAGGMPLAAICLRRD